MEVALACVFACLLADLAVQFIYPVTGPDDFSPTDPLLMRFVPFNFFRVTAHWHGNVTSVVFYFLCMFIT